MSSDAEVAAAEATTATQGSKRLRWTEDEIRTLCDLYPTRPTADVARALGRTRRAVSHKAELIGLRKTTRRLIEMGRACRAMRRAKASSASSS